VAEGEVLTHHDTGGAQPVGEHPLDELGRAEPRHLQRELQHPDLVHAQLLQQIGSAPRRRQARRAVAGPHELVRMRLERERHGTQPSLARDGDGPLDHPLVAEVHAVEHADRDDRSLRFPHARPHSLVADHSLHKPAMLVPVR
jgi:hypothetical protein